MEHNTAKIGEAQEGSDHTLGVIATLNALGKYETPWRFSGAG